MHTEDQNNKFESIKLSSESNTKILNLHIEEKSNEMIEYFINLKKKRIRDKSDNVQKFDKILQDINKANAELKITQHSLLELTEDNKKIKKLLNIQTISQPDEEERRSSFGDYSNSFVSNWLNMP